MKRTSEQRERSILRRASRFRDHWTAYLPADDVLFLVRRCARLAPHENVGWIEEWVSKGIAGATWRYLWLTAEQEIIAGGASRTNRSR